MEKEIVDEKNRLEPLLRYLLYITVSLYARWANQDTMDHSPIRQTFELGKLITNH